MVQEMARTCLWAAASMRGSGFSFIKSRKISESGFLAARYSDNRGLSRVKIMGNCNFVLKPWVLTWAVRSLMSWSENVLLLGFSSCVLRALLFANAVLERCCSVDAFSVAGACAGI